VNGHSIRGKTIFVTGGAGFIGTSLAEKLLDHDNRIVAFDNLARNSLAKRAIRTHPNLSVIQGDVVDEQAITDAMLSTDPEIVVHMAAVAGIDTVVKSPINTMMVNLMGTVNAVGAASKLKRLERFIDFSTSEVFGSQAFRVQESEATSIGAVGEARWIYAVSKLAGEHLVHAYHREREVPTVTLRPFNVYGPGQVGEGAIHHFVVAALKDEDLQIHGDGTQIRAWCYIDDMVEAVMLAMVDPRAIGQSFNIGNPRAVTTIYGLANTVIRVLGSKSSIRWVWKDYTDIELRVPSANKAQERLGFEAKIDLDEGIRRTGDYYRAVQHVGVPVQS
jgi:UDP-glucose 4-epimerase